MHTLYGALLWPYVPVRVPRGALVLALQYIYSPLRSRTSQYRRTFISLSVSLWNDFAYPAFDGVELVGFKSRANSFLLASAALSIFIYYYFPFLFFLSIGWYCGVSYTDEVSITLSQPCRPLQ